MPNREIRTSIKKVSMFNIQTIASDTTTAGNIIDNTGFDALTLAIQSGTITDGTYTVLVEHDDVVGFGSATTVASTDIDGTITFDNTESNIVKGMSYVGNKPFVRLSIISAGTTAGGIFGGVDDLGLPTTSPVA